MTPSLLRQWSFQNSQPDQWWLSLDGVTEEIPVTVAEIEERLKSGDYSAFQVLHISQGDMENAPWVEVTMPPVMKAPPVRVIGNVKSNEQHKTGEHVTSQPLANKAEVVPIQFSLKQFFVILAILALPLFIYLTYGEEIRKETEAKKRQSEANESKREERKRQSQGSVRATGIALTLEKRKALYRDAILSEMEAKKQAAILFPMPDVNSNEYRESGVALSIMTKQNEEEERIKKELWKSLVRDYGITEDTLIEIIVEGYSGKWPKP